MFFALTSHYEANINCTVKKLRFDYYSCCRRDEYFGGNEGVINGTKEARQPLRNQNRKPHSRCLCDPDANNNITCKTLTGRGSSGHQSTDLLCLNLTEEQFQRLFFSSTYASHPLVESSSLTNQTRTLLRSPNLMTCTQLC